MTEELSEQSKMWLVMLRKENLLSELLTWLKAKGLYEEAMRDCPSGIKEE